MASVDLQDPDHMNKENVQRLKVLISILRAFVTFLSEPYHVEDEGQEFQEFKVRLKHLDDVVLVVIQELQPLADVQENEDWESSPTTVQLVVFILNVLKRLGADIYDISNLVAFVPRLDYLTAEHVVSFIDSLLENLNYIFTCRTITNVLMKKELEDLKERLILFRYLLWLIPNRLFEQGIVKHVFALAQGLALPTSYVLYSICSMTDIEDDEMFHEMIESNIPNLLNLFGAVPMEEVSNKCNEYWESLVPIADDTHTMDEQMLAFIDYLIHKLRLIAETEIPFSIVAAKDLIHILIDELSFLRCNLMDHLLLQNPIKEMESLTISTQDLIFKTGLFIYMSCDIKDEEQMAEYCCFKLPDLLKVVDNLKLDTSYLFIYYMYCQTEEDEQMAGYCCFKLPDLLKAVDDLKLQASDLFSKCFSESGASGQSNCSSINVLEYANFIINKMEEMLHSGEASLNALKHQIEKVNEETVSMRKLFCDIAELGNSQMESLLAQYKDAVYQAKYLIDTSVTNEGSLWCHKLGLFVVAKDLKILQRKVKSLQKMIRTCDSTIPSHSSGASSQDNNPPNINFSVGSKGAADKLVVLKDEEAEIIELLTGGSKQLKIVSIVGMPGLGKTTLANSVYKHPSINLHFHVRAWCCASQVYEKDSMLFDIFGQIVGKAIQSQETSRADFVQKLYQSLKGKKYLIVIDDIWDIKAWNDLKATFPEDNNGSRILFTTRHRAVALEVNSIPYALRLLSLEESCELLWLKLFDGETCPPELSTISKFIARNCKGLPLEVVLIAGILKRTERKENCWKHVAETLNRSQIASEKYLDILEFSYEHLPDCLKPCFLYFGTFPEDTTISASKLIQLWICEGFVQQPNPGHDSLEQVAENYLNDLVDKSLVMIESRSSKGGVKECRIHDVLREFCSIKLQDERFLMQEHKFGGTFILHGYSQGRIGCGAFIFHGYSQRTISSLSYYYRSDRAVKFGRRQLRYDFILQYKLLRVLDLENVQFESGAKTCDLVNVAKLVHLRYLAIRVIKNEIPSEIGNLRNLKTFRLTGAVGEVMLPEVIWNLVSLRHILKDHSFFSLQHYCLDFFQNFPELDHLKSFCTLSLCHGDNVEKFILRRLTGVQKLGCKFSNSWDDSTGCNLFPALDFLSELESLKLLFFGKALYPCKFSFPSNLKKLSLSNFRLPWDEISIIGRLPNLEVLKLLNKAFEGNQWDMNEGEFQKLKFLKLDSLNIKLWSAFSEHLPCLEKLVVLRCQQLEEIPSSFGEISTLQLIEMKWCNSSATDSVMQILEEQRDMSNNQLNVTLVGP
ncbi:hypothetical protein ACH5RR_034457 [Cinchona calisaya]|uniref:Uncharacterized protein n=1 Tax=Cinchona calisaya TaxID=153742 RepID=A0ABD2YCB1_9GENT